MGGEAVISGGKSSEDPVGRLKNSTWYPRCKLYHRGRSHESNPPLHTATYYADRSNADMGLRNTLSRLTKKLKHRLAGKRKPERTGAGADVVERVDTINPLPQPEPDTTAVEGGQGGNGANADGRGTASTDRPLSDRDVDGPEPALAASRSGNDQDRGEADVEGREVSQGYSHSHIDGEVAVGYGSGPRPEGNDIDGGEADQVHPPPSNPAIPRGEGPESTWLWLLILSHPTIPSDNSDTPAVPNHVSDTLHPDENIAPGADAGKNKSDWRSTTSASAKLLLRGVRNSADAFPPLKSIAGGLCFILENCEVQPSYIRYPQC